MNILIRSLYLIAVKLHIHVSLVALLDSASVVFVVKADWDLAK